MAKTNDNHRKNSRGSRSFNSSKKQNPKRNQNRNVDTGEKFDNNTRDHYTNDPRWYAMDEQMLKDAASINFSEILGGVNRTYSTSNHYFTAGSAGEAFPGIMTIETTPVPGVSKDNGSAVNIAARNLHSFVRHQNSGHANYDSPDIMMFVLAMDSLYSLWAHMVRAYGIMNTYAVYNKYYAQAMFDAMGLDFDDFSYRAADFRTFINMFAHKMSKICCPTDITYVTRHVWMYSHIWLDSQSKKAQSYLYVPRWLWQYDEVGSIKGGRLTRVQLGYGMCFDDLRNLANEMLAKIIDSEDMMIMSGDILKAFGSDKIMSLTTIPDDFMIEPKFDPAVCSQFQNCFLVGNFTDDFVIEQDPDTLAILCNPKIQNSSLVELDHLHLNLRMDAPTPADVMVATRLMPTMSQYDQTNKQRTLTSCGSDIAHTAAIYYYRLDPQSGRRVLSRSVITSILEVSDDTQSIGSGLHDLIQMEKFDWHPTQYVYDADGNETGVSGDVDNFTRIAPATLEDIHNLAIISQLGCRSMGSFSMK